MCFFHYNFIVGKHEWGQKRFLKIKNILVILLTTKSRIAKTI